MDIVQFPDPSEGSMLYGYIIMLIVFVAASITVRRLKKANKKQMENEQREQIMYEMVNEEKDIK